MKVGGKCRVSSRDQPLPSMHAMQTRLHQSSQIVNKKGLGHEEKIHHLELELSWAFVWPALLCHLRSASVIINAFVGLGVCC